MAEYALRLENGTDTAPRVRQLDALLLTPTGPLQARSGVRDDGGGWVLVNGGTMQLEVTPLQAYVDGGSADGQGGYVFVLDAPKQITVSDGHATLARTDTVAVVVHDDSFDGSGETSAEVVVVEGTPGGGAPALPTTAMPIIDVTVPAGTSAGTGGLSWGMLGSYRTKFLPKGIVRVDTTSERNELDVYEGTWGQVVYNGETDQLEVSGISGWKASHETGLAKPWVNVTSFSNGWGVGSGFLRCKIDNAGNLHLQGKLQSVGSHGTLAFTLPVGYRPSMPEWLKLSMTGNSTADMHKANLSTETGEVSIYITGSPSYVVFSHIIPME